MTQKTKRARKFSRILYQREFALKLYTRPSRCLRKWKFAGIESVVSGGHSCVENSQFTLSKTFLKSQKSRWSGELNSVHCFIMIWRIFRCSVHEDKERKPACSPSVYEDFRIFVDAFHVNSPPNRWNRQLCLVWGVAFASFEDWEPQIGGECSPGPKHLTSLRPDTTDFYHQNSRPYWKKLVFWRPSIPFSRSMRTFGKPLVNYYRIIAVRSGVKCRRT